MGTYLDARDAGAMGADHGVPDDDPPPAPTVAWLTSQQLEAFWNIARQAENLSSAAEELESKADALAYEAKSLQEQAAKLWDAADRLSIGMPTPGDNPEADHDLTQYISGEGNPR